MPDENTPQETSLETAVENAAATPPSETPAQEAVETPAQEEPKVPAEDPRVAQAMQIYEALNNPATASAAVEFLAKQMGYQLQAPAQTQAQPEGIKELIAKELGDDYAFLAPKLGGAIENVINRVMGPMQQQIQRAQVTNEFDRAMADLNAETKGEFGKHESEIVKVLQRLRPADGVSTKEFLRDAYNLARAGKSSPAGKAVVSRINERAQEILPSPAAGAEPPRVSEQQTLDAAIYEAAKALGMVS